jgi:hypothetical protein
MVAHQQRNIIGLINSNMKVKSLIFLSVLLSFLSCTPEDGVDGKDGANGVNGVDGSDGFSIGLVSTDLGNGCRELTFFRDVNNNGVQDGSESSITSFEVCSGITPNIAMVSQYNTSCPNGGKIFTFFNDLDDDGVLDSNEDVLGSDSICNGENGVDGIDGNAGSGYALFIEQATTSECANGGFVVSVFTDLNSNAEYDSGIETISNSTVICYPDRESIEYPDYSLQGHTMEALGVWRLYSVSNKPVAEENRFNIHIYPDPLNPNKLTTDGTPQTGLMDFKDQKAIPWSYAYGRVNSSNNTTGNFNVDESRINGISEDLPDFLRWVPATSTEAAYLKWYFNSQVVDLEIFPEGLSSATFYKIQ